MNNLDGRIDKVGEPGELQNAVEALSHVGDRNAEDRGVQEDVVPAAEFGMKAGSHFHKGHQPTGNGDIPTIRRSDAGEQFDQGRLAGTIGTNNAQRLATPNVEAHIFQCPKALCFPKPEQSAAASAVVVNTIGL